MPSASALVIKSSRGRSAPGSTIGDTGFGDPDYRLYRNTVSVSLDTSANICLRVADEVREAMAYGDRLIDATYKAVDQITHFTVKLEDYSVRSVTGGQEAMGEATVKVCENCFPLPSPYICGESSQARTDDAHCKAARGWTRRPVEDRRRGLLHSDVVTKALLLSRA